MQSLPQPTPTQKRTNHEDPHPAHEGSTVMRITADEWANAEALGMLLALAVGAAWIVGGIVARWVSK
jgi:hypothetical protein